MGLRMVVVVGERLELLVGVWVFGGLGLWF